MIFLFIPNDGWNFILISWDNILYCVFLIATTVNFSLTDIALFLSFLLTDVWSLHIRQQTFPVTVVTDLTRFTFCNDIFHTNVLLGKWSVWFDIGEPDSLKSVVVFPEPLYVTSNVSSQTGPNRCLPQEDDQSNINSESKIALRVVLLHLLG